MSHFFSVGERALLRAFGKTERDVLIRYGKSLVGKKRKEEKGKGSRDGQNKDREGN